MSELAVGAVDISLDVQIVDDSGLGVTELLAATFPDVYISKGTGADIGPIVLSDLASLTSAHSDGGVKERGGGYYRLDAPDSLGSTICPKVTIRGEVSGKHLIASPVQVVATAGAGTGARTVVITVDDGTDPIEGANVRVTQGATTLVLPTNVNGIVTFFLDDATWSVGITKFGYTFAGASLIVNGDEAVTYSLTELVITPSAGPDQVTGYLVVHDESGDPVAGVKVYVKQTKVVSGSGIAYDGTPRSSTSDVNGLVEFPGMYIGGRYKIYREADEPNAVHLTVATGATDPYELPSIISRS